MQKKAFTDYEVADPLTDQRFLPPCMRRKDSNRRMRHYKAALRQGMSGRLSSVQREYIYLYYWKRMRKSDIARKKGTSCSAVSRSMHAGEQALRDYVEMYMRVYDTLEQEFLQDELL